MTILVFDTETTGLPDFKKPSSGKDQPHLVQLAAILAENDGTKVASMDFVVRPDGWEIPAEVAAIHGITTEKALATGFGLKFVLTTFETMLARADRSVAHNWYFDRKIIKTALFRAGMEAGALDALDHFCTMQAARKHLGAQGKLAMMYEKIMGRPMTAAHSSMGDAVASLRIYQALRPDPPAARAGVDGGNLYSRVQDAPGVREQAPPDPELNDAIGI